MDSLDIVGWRAPGVGGDARAEAAVYPISNVDVNRR